MLLWQAPAAPAASGGGGYYNIILLGAMFFVVYFLMIAPQRKARKVQASFQENLKKGRKVVTIGGIHGTIIELTDTAATLMIAPKVHIKVQRDAISSDNSLAAYPDTGAVAEVEAQEVKADAGKES